MQFSGQWADGEVFLSYVSKGSVVFTETDFLFPLKTADHYTSYNPSSEASYPPMLYTRLFLLLLWLYHTHLLHNLCNGKEQPRECINRLEVVKKKKSSQTSPLNLLF